MYVRQDVQDHVTIMNKALYDNLQDGIDEAKEGVSATQESVGELEKKTNEALMETNKTVETLNRDMAEFEEEVNDNFNTVNENVEEQVSGLKKLLLVFKNKVIETLHLFQTPHILTILTRLTFSVQVLRQSMYQR